MHKNFCATLHNKYVARNLSFGIYLQYTGAMSCSICIFRSRTPAVEEKEMTVMTMQFFPLKQSIKDTPDKKEPLRSRPKEEDHSDTAMLNAAIRRAKYASSQNER